MSIFRGKNAKNVYTAVTEATPGLHLDWIQVRFSASLRYNHHSRLKQFQQGVNRENLAPLSLSKTMLLKRLGARNCATVLLTLLLIIT